MLSYFIIVAIIASFLDNSYGSPLNGTGPSFYCANARKFPLERNAVRDQRMKWPQETVIYQMDSGLSQSDRDTILSGFREITSKTGCVQFRERSNQRDYVLVQKRDSGCYAHLGKIGGRQLLNLGSGCMYKMVVIHEAMHTLGFDHEHVRSDRDNFVRIEWDNIEREYKFAFDKVSDRDYTTDGLSYDFKSIMHYPWNAFAIDSRKATITSLKGRQQMGGNELTQKDIDAMKKHYQC